MRFRSWVLLPLCPTVLLVLESLPSSGGVTSWIPDPGRTDSARKLDTSARTDGRAQVDEVLDLPVGLNPRGRVNPDLAVVAVLDTSSPVHDAQNLTGTSSHVTGLIELVELRHLHVVPAVELAYLHTAAIAERPANASRSNVSPSSLAHHPG